MAGASAANLPRFATDFPFADGSPAPTLELSTSWRNPPRTSAHRQRGLGGRRGGGRSLFNPLRSRPDAAPGTVRWVCCAMSKANANGSPITIAARYREAAEAGAPVPTAAVLLRRNADSGPIAEGTCGTWCAGRGRGLAGLLSVGEVADGWRC